MAEQPNNLEMFDVLASIRRLVSEERNSAPPRIEPVPPAPPRSDTAPDGDKAVVGTVAAPGTESPVTDGLSAPPRYKGLPQESRFVLTAALRVGEEAAPADTQKAWDEDARQDTVADADSAAPIAPPAHDADDIERRTASLEETIAELEAAVADIGSEFEPDGGEDDDLVTELFPEADAQAAANGQSPRSDVPTRRSNFQGIMAGFEDMTSPEEALDAPVTGDALIPPVAFSRGASAPTSGRAHSPFGRSWAANYQGKPDEPAPEAPKTANATFVHASAPMAKSGAAAGDEDVAEELDLDEVPDEGAGASENAVKADAADGDALGAADLDDTAEDDAEPDADLADVASVDLADESLAGYSAGADEEQDEIQPEPLIAAQRPGRPQIVRSLAPVAGDAKDGGDLGGAVAADDLPDDDEPDLFNPLASADLDMQAMRDIVAELVREELRGVLGERITRNLRALVRNEIRKALGDKGPSQG